MKKVGRSDAANLFCLMRCLERVHGSREPKSDKAEWVKKALLMLISVRLF